MTQKLTELFDIEPTPSVEHNDTIISDNDKEVVEEDVEVSKSTFSRLTEIDRELKTSIDLSTTDAELDLLADKATNKFDELMELGLGVEPRFGPPIFDSASRLLGHAITARTNKIEKKLKAIDLDLKRRKVELLEREAGSGEESPVDGKATLLGRNEIMEMLRDKDSI